MHNLQDYDTIVLPMIYSLEQQKKNWFMHGPQDYDKIVLPMIYSLEQ